MVASIFSGNPTTLFNGEALHIALIFLPILLSLIVVAVRLRLYGTNAKNLRDSIRIVVWVGIATLGTDLWLRK